MENNGTITINMNSQPVKKKESDTGVVFLPIAVIVSFMVGSLAQLLIESLSANLFAENEVNYLITRAISYSISLVSGTFTLIIPILFSFSQKTFARKLSFVSSAFISQCITVVLQCLAQTLACLIIYRVDKEAAISTFGLIIEILGVISNIFKAIFSAIIYVTINKKIGLEKLKEVETNNDEESVMVDANANINVNINPKSKTVAALLCFFFGSLGIHRFYAGKIGTGFLWLLTAGLCGIGSFVDFFLILLGLFKDSNGYDLS